MYDKTTSKGEKIMYHQEHQIAQAEHAAFLARFYRPAPGGITVRAPNLLERILAGLRHLLMRPPHYGHKITLAQKAAK
jgi:hypothetical protein